MCRNLLFGVKFFFNTPGGTLGPNSAIRNCTFINNNFRPDGAYAAGDPYTMQTYSGYVSFPRIASYVPKWPIEVKDITIIDGTCYNSPACTQLGLNIYVPVNASNIYIRNVQALHLINYEFYGAFSNTTYTHFRNVTIVASRSYSHVFRWWLGSVTPYLPVDFPYPDTSDINVFCNHVNHATAIVAPFYSYGPSVVNVGRMYYDYSLS